MRWLAAGLLLLFLAGCGSKATDGTTNAPDAFVGVPLPIGEGLGSIRGLVTDGAVRPVAGVNVTMMETKQHVLTDAQGRFQFASVAPGVHFLTAAKPGYAKTQTSVEVEADAAPRLTQIRLDALPGTAPYFTVLKWDGFMQCSFIVAGSFGTGCLVTVATNATGDDSRRFDAIDQTPAFLQNELRWDPTQALGTNLCTRTYASKDIGGDLLGPDTCGPSPLVQRYNGTILQSTGVGAGKGIERVVYVASYVDQANAAGLALNQDFTVYTHLFYNFSPPADWTFGADGDPVVPA